VSGDKVNDFHIITCMIIIPIARWMPAAQTPTVSFAFKSFKKKKTILFFTPFSNVRSLSNQMFKRFLRANKMYIVQYVKYY